MVSIIGDFPEAVRRVEQFIEILPDNDLKGIDLIVLKNAKPAGGRLGRYLYAPPSGFVEVYMGWFTDLAAFGVRVLLGRTVVHQVGHHNARHVANLNENEAFACGYEVAHIAQMFGPEVMPIQKVKID